jgi:uncharacterized protein
VATGVVLELWRYPVKSMAGEGLAATHVDGGGVIGDRAHALMHDHKGERKPLTAREAPRMLAWTATYPFAPDGTLRPGTVPNATVIGPDGRHHRWGDPRLRRALAADLGREVDFVRDPGGALHDLPQTLLVTLESSRRALETELGSAVDGRRFRPNVHIELDVEAFSELHWEGATLAFAGGVRLRLLHPCERCVIPTIDPRTREKWPEMLRHLARSHATAFGINARVITGGRLHVGEHLALNLR